MRKRLNKKQIIAISVALAVFFIIVLLIVSYNFGFFGFGVDSDENEGIEDELGSEFNEINNLVDDLDFLSESVDEIDDEGLEIGKIEEISNGIGEASALIDTLESDSDMSYKFKNI